MFVCVGKGTTGGKGVAPASATGNGANALCAVWSWRGHLLVSDTLSLTCQLDLEIKVESGGLTYVCIVIL
jgi:hypothetical protein